MPDPSFSLADEYYFLSKAKKIYPVTFKGACKLLDCICKCVHQKNHSTHLDYQFEIFSPNFITRSGLFVKIKSIIVLLV